ncbi:DUF6565 domain-containing protein [Rufibacter tibetensis]|uniref:DUF6565 domain-containing protein n=1 Tax=Rufibacter tibetensis TaxID=512763 RepID=UPI000782602D|nr:DUF6565 domain-containing protein [Rufibacter tibetensis]
MDFKYYNFMATGALFLALLAGTSCERTSNSDSTTQASNKAEEDLADLREWVKDKTRKTDSTLLEKGPQVREGFKERTARLDAKLESLSEKSKEEYKELRREYENWETRNQQRSATPLHPETMKRMETELFGSATSLDVAIPANQMREVYTQFLQNVRIRRASWTASDWDYVDDIYTRLNQKKDQVEDQLTANDRIKIKALQAEYLTLEARKDAKDLLREIKQ